MPLTPPPPPPALILAGAQVWTDQGQTTGPKPGWAVLIQGSMVKAVGPERRLRLEHPGARVVNLPGGTLLPGLIEGHAHVGDLGAARLQVDLAGITSLSEALKRTRAWTLDHPEGWIRGRGWDQNLWSSKAFPLAGDLDAAIGDRPAFLERVDGHAAWVNSAALKLAGITRKTPDPSGGQIIRDAKGEPTGVLVDLAMALVTGHIPPATPQQRENRLLEGLAELRNLGFSGVADMGIDREDLAAYQRLQAQNRLPIRVFAYLSFDPNWTRVGLVPLRRRDLGFFQVQGVKFFLDGALGSRGARLLEPYADAPHRGLWVTDPAVAKKAVAAVVRAGYQPAVHAIGDSANHAALELLTGLPKGGPPPRIEHAQIITAEDAGRFGRLGVIASVQPVHCTSDFAWTPGRLGPQRLGEAFPWRKLITGGATLAFGSDAPIENANPFIALAAAETRQNPAGQPAHGFLPDQRLTRTEAIQAYTAGNAKALDRPTLGRIRTGAVADLLWVQAPILELSPEALRRLRPGRLWVDGQEVPVARMAP